jgi:outer membrane protein assembly factor BamE
MQMSFSRSDRSSALAGVFCLVLAACIAGCASKNPLMDDAPAAGNASVSGPAAAPTRTVEAKTPIAPAQNSGTRVTEPTRMQRFLGIFTPYRVDVQQGNFIAREMVDQLKEGMQRPEGVTREQVRFVLGTPLLTDVFHADRWDYLFRLQKRSGEVISSRVTVFFDNNRLARIDGGVLPTEQEYLAFIAGSAPGSTPAAAPNK